MADAIRIITTVVVLALVAFALVDWLTYKHRKVRPKRQLPEKSQSIRNSRQWRDIEEYIKAEGFSIDDKPAEMFKAIHSAVEHLWGKHPIPGVNRWWRTKLQCSVEFNDDEISAEKCDELLDVAAEFWGEIHTLDEIGGWPHAANSFYLTDEQLEPGEDDSDDE